MASNSAWRSRELSRAVHDSVERVMKMLDLPRRSDIDALNENLDRVARALENLGTARPHEERDEPASPTNEPS